MITVSIWRKTLVKHDDCLNGMILFDQIAAMQSASDTRRTKRIKVSNWTPLHSVWLYVNHINFAAWLERLNLIPKTNLRNANLRNVNLRNADLSYADLRSADLRNANLRNADLSYAYRGLGQEPIPGWHTLVSGYLEKDV